MSARTRVIQAFHDRLGEAATFVTRAPGRVNLIGEHTDYNDGFVLPMAIDRDVCIALRPRPDHRVIVHSLDFAETADFETGVLTHDAHTWIDYLKGVAWALADAGQTPTGWEGVMGGDVPRGAGLSSSAAVELAALRAFAAVAGSAWEPTQAAQLGKRVENEWIGVNSGIMDPLVVASATQNHAMLIDCRSLKAEAVPLPDNVAVIVLDTNTRRGLVDSAYNERRRQCEAAAMILGVPALRDVDLPTLQRAGTRLDPVTLRRARHVVTENERTLQAAAALRAGDLRRLGELMNASHASLRDDFEVTNDALNTMVAIAQVHEVCFGARMTGAGFGGCAVALAPARAAASFITDVQQRYQSATGLVASAYACQAAPGTTLETFMESVQP